LAVTGDALGLEVTGDTVGLAVVTTAEPPPQEFETLNIYMIEVKRKTNIITVKLKKYSKKRGRRITM
jgi:hypothetical protein